MQKNKRYGMILIIIENIFFLQPDRNAYKIPAASIAAFNTVECTDKDAIKSKKNRRYFIAAGNFAKGACFFSFSPENSREYFRIELKM